MKLWINNYCLTLLCFSARINICPLFILQYRIILFWLCGTLCGNTQCTFVFLSPDCSVGQQLTAYPIQLSSIIIITIIIITIYYCYYSGLNIQCTNVRLTFLPEFSSFSLFIVSCIACIKCAFINRTHPINSANVIGCY